MTYENCVSSVPLYKVYWNTTRSINFFVSVAVMPQQWS